MNRILFWILIFLEGGLVLLLELTIPHVTMPILGNSINTWSKMISLSVSGLALGYFVGEFLSRNKIKRLINLRNLLISVIFLISVLIFLIILRNKLLFSLESEIFFSWFIAFSGLLLINIFLGGISTLCLYLLNDEKNCISGTTGQVFAFSSFGGIFFSLLTGYYLLPAHGIIYSLYFSLVIICIYSLFYFFFSGEKKMIFLPFIFLFVLLFFDKKYKSDLGNGLASLHHSEGLNGQLIVADIPGNEDSTDIDRIFFINRLGQTWVNYRTATSKWSYVNFVTRLAGIYPPGSKSLVLGLGGGIASVQINLYAKHEVDAVELDQQIIDIAYNHFGLGQSQVNVHCEDARRYIKKCKNKYDFILMDIFNGEVVPSHGLSLEAMQEVQKMLNDKGMLVINFNGFLQGDLGKSGRTLLKTLLESGFEVNILPTLENWTKDRNNLFIAYKSKPQWKQNFNNIILTDSKTGKELVLENLFIDLGGLDFFHERLITDDFPTMEYINQPAADVWRNEYLINFTLKMKDAYSYPIVK